MIELLNRESQLAAFEVFHFAGHWDANGKSLTEAIKQVLPKRRIPTFHMPWMVVRILSKWIPLCFEMLEVKYLWDKPYQLVNHRLVEFLGHEPGTDLNEAVAESLRGLKCT